METAQQQQCSRLSQEFGFAYLSVGDLLRSELAAASSSRGPPSPQCAAIERHLRQGSNVPPTLANKVLLRAIEKQAARGDKTFLVEGFPRTIEQAESFVKVCDPIHIYAPGWQAYVV